MRRGPEATTREIADVAPLTVVVARAVGAPPRDGELLVPAVPRPGVAQHDRERETRQQPDARLWRVRRIDLPNRGLLRLDGDARALGVARLCLLHNEASRNTFVQHQLHRTSHRLRVKAALPWLVAERVRECDEAHPDVMRHVRADDRLRLPGVRTRVVHGLAEAVRPKQSFTLECGRSCASPRSARRAARGRSRTAQ
jgi:hypothetical protein